MRPGRASPTFRNRSIPGDIIRKLFLAGEIADLTAQITELNGYMPQEKADKAVKN